MRLQYFFKYFIKENLRSLTLDLTDDGLIGFFFMWLIILFVGFVVAPIILVLAIVTSPYYFVKRQMQKNKKKKPMPVANFKMKEKWYGRIK